VQQAKGGSTLDKKCEYGDLARAHFEIQKYYDRWDPLEGLFRGTIFPELYRPYHVDENGEYCEEICKDAPVKRRSSKAKGGKSYGKR
jgi:hypothetical protein